MKIKRIIPFMAAAMMLTASCGREGNKGGGLFEGFTVSSRDTIPLMVKQIRQCSRLYTAEYKVHKIVTHSDTTKVSGSILGKSVSLSLPGGRRKVAIPIDATLKAYIDFSELQEEDIRREDGMVIVRLPKPHVVMTSSSIDHEGIKKYVSLIRSDFSDEELSMYEKQGRNDIISQVPNLGILQTARRSAATQLLPIIAMLGIPQENIIIEFSGDDTSDEDIANRKEGLFGNTNANNNKQGQTWIMD